MNQALFSDDRRYRYLLFVQWDATLPQNCIIGMNGSKADENRSDHTITKCVNYSKAWGCGSLLMLNLFGLMSTNPKGLLTCEDPVGPLNTVEFLREKSSGSKFVVAAWGDYRKYVAKKFRYRWLDVVDAIPELKCFRQTKEMPHHPARLPFGLTPIPFMVQR